MERKWTVGELAEQAGVSVRTLHHYDEIGLLTPMRSAAGHRCYAESDLARLTQIVALRSVGLSLDEIGRCLESGEPLAVTLTRQLDELELRVAQTTALRDRVAVVLAQLQNGRNPDRISSSEPTQLRRRPVDNTFEPRPSVPYRRLGALRDLASTSPGD